MIFRPTPNWISDKFDWSVVVEFEVGALLPPRFVSSMFHSVSMEQTAKTHPGWSGLNCRPNLGNGIHMLSYFRNLDKKQHVGRIYFHLPKSKLSESLELVHWWGAVGGCMADASKWASSSLRERSEEISEHSDKESSNESWDGNTARFLSVTRNDCKAAPLNSDERLISRILGCLVPSFLFVLAWLSWVRFVGGLAINWKSGFVIC